MQRGKGNTEEAPMKVPGLLALCAVSIISFGAISHAQHLRTQQSPSQDIEQVTSESESEPQQPFCIADRPIYRAIQDAKNNSTTDSASDGSARF